MDGFLKLERVTLFGSGLYLFNPRNTTGTPSFFTALQGRPPVPNSATDQYSLQAGAALRMRAGRPVPSVAYRVEGVPVRDAFGSSDGFRRPGTIQFVEPRVSMALGSHTVSVAVPIKVYVNVKYSPFSVRREDATVPDAMVLMSWSLGF